MSFAADAAGPPRWVPIFRRPRSILFWLRCLVIVTLIPAWVVTIWLIHESWERDRTALEHSTVDTTRALMQAVDRDLASSVAALQALATSPLLAQGDLAGFHRQAAQALPNLAGYSIVLVDRSGAELLNTAIPYGDALPRIVALNQWVDTIFQTGKPAISDLFIGKVARQPIVAIGVPVIINGTVAYDLGMGMHPQSLAEILRRQNFSGDWVAAIVDSTGTFVARTHNADQFIGTKVPPALLRKIEAEHEGVTEGPTLEGTSVVMGFTRSAISGWTVGIAIPRAALMAPFYRSLRLTISAATILLLLALSSAWLIGARIARSIRALNEPALALAADAPVHVSPLAIREVNEIGAALTKASHLLNARRMAREEAEQAERSMAIAQAFARLNNACVRLWQAGTLQQGLDEILAATIDLLGADRGSIQLLDPQGNALNIAIQRGFERDRLELLHASLGKHDTACNRALRTAAPVVIDDIDADAAYAPFRSIARAVGFRAVVSAPLIGKRGATLGVASAHFEAPHRPSAIELRHLNLYVRLASAFIERFKAEEALRESNARLAAETKAMVRFYEVGSRLWEKKSLQDGLEETLAGIIDLLGADMGAVQLLDRGSNSLRMVAHRGFNQEFLDYFREIGVEQNDSFSRALRSGKPEIIADTELDPAMQFRSIRRTAGYRAVVAAPLVDGRGTVLGMLSAHFRAPHAPSESELRWLELYRRRAADFIQRLKTREALQASEERLRLALETAHLATWDRDARTGAHIWNDEFFRMFGYEVGEIEPTQAAWASRIHPEDRAAAEGTVERFDREHEDCINEFRIIRPDGGVRWIRARGRYLYYDGEPLRTIGIVEDVTEARQQVETQRVLVAELQHRTRNLMAVVQSIALQTLDTVDSLPDFEKRFNQRLSALSRAQSLLSQTDNGSITLGAVVRMEFEALGPDTISDKAVFAGPEVPLRKSFVEMLALAVHELLTNAIKYGALGSPNGRISVSWRIEGAPPDRRLVLEWLESGMVQPLSPAAQRPSGYGRRLIEEALPYSLAAETRFELSSDGLRCVISLPLAATGDIDEMPA